jgi:hypothetical protein
MGSSLSSSASSDVQTTQTALTNAFRKVKALKHQAKLQQGGLIKRSRKFQNKIQRKRSAGRR